VKKRYLILIAICIIFVQNSVRAVDYYPELGMDPFYSSLNPMNAPEDDTLHEHDSLFSIFKSKKEAAKTKKQTAQPVQNVSGKRQKALFSIKQKEEKKETPAVNVTEKPAPAETEQAEVTDLIEKTDLTDTETDNDGMLETSDDTFVTPEKKHMTRKELEKALEEEEREKQKALEQQQSNYTSIKDRLFFFKKKQAPLKPVPTDPEIELTSDYMEYFPDRYEVEAIGNARVLFKRQDTIITANKIVFNYDKNILRASENVVLISPDSTTEGDFVKLDLSEPNGWIENPLTKTEDIQLTAKEAFLYSDKIEEYDGVAKILRDETIKIGGRSFANYLNPNRIYNTNETALSDDSKGVYKIKANKIIVDSKQDHEVITIKNANLYIKNFRIAALPTMQVVTNKEHQSAETNLPEMGSQSMLGMHFGPAVVLNVPGGSTLKLAPILTYKDDKLGFGGIARFRNQKNMTEVAYGTSVNQLVIRGRHKFAPGWLLNYSRYTNESEWFLGYRMPKYGAQLSYSRADYVKDLKLMFSQQYSVGAFIDRSYGRPNMGRLRDTEWRFRWMTQTYKPIYEYMNEEGNIGFSTGLVAQTAATVYTTGDTLGMFRIGPALRTKLGPWNQAFIYYQTASAGQSPFYFDRYRYGRSNFVIMENLKVCKYLTVGYMASLSINSDYNDKMFQENRIVFGVGPEYAKVVFGYDARRRNAMINLLMLVGTKDSDVEFKKSEIINPNRFGKKREQQKKEKKRNYRKFLKDDVPIVLDDKK
jgi:hypothetical protein